MKQITNPTLKGLADSLYKTRDEMRAQGKKYSGFDDIFEYKMASTLVPFAGSLIAAVTATTYANISLDSPGPITALIMAEACSRIGPLFEEAISKKKYESCEARMVDTLDSEGLIGRARRYGQYAATSGKSLIEKLK